MSRCVPDSVSRIPRVRRYAEAEQTREVWVHANSTQKCTTAVTSKERLLTGPQMLDVRIPNVHATAPLTTRRDPVQLRVAGHFELGFTPNECKALPPVVPADPARADASSPITQRGVLRLSATPPRGYGCSSSWRRGRPTVRLAASALGAYREPHRDPSELRVCEISGAASRRGAMQLSGKRVKVPKSRHN